MDFSEREANRPLPISWLRNLNCNAPQLVVVVSENTETGDLSTVRVPRLGRDEVRRVWQQVVDRESAAWLAPRFRVNLPEIRAALREAKDTKLVLQHAGPSDGSTGTSTAAIGADRESLARAVRDRGARRMGPSVKHLRSDATLAQLVLPESLKRQVEDMINWYRCSDRVFHEMKYRPKSRLGRGMSTLFTGPPGIFLIPPLPSVRGSRNLCIFGNPSMRITYPPTIDIEGDLT